VVNLVAQTGGGIVLENATTIQVCNTSPDNTRISNIALINNVNMNPPAAGNDYTIATGLSLNAGQCQTYTPVYRPNGCVTNDGRCSFQDTVRISSIPTDEFGAALPAGRIPLPQTAECRVCPFGSCSLVQP
jgi:hypothetical protein